MTARSLVAFAFLLSACAKSDGHAGYLNQDCDGPNCHSNILPGTGKGPSGGGLDAGSGGNADAGDASTHSLSGNVGITTDELFLTASPFSGAGVVGATGKTRRVAGAFSGGTYTLDGAETGTVLWLDLKDNASTDDVMPTIVAVDGTADLVDVAFAKKSVIERILGALSRPRTLAQTSGAEVVISFVDKSNNALSGVFINGGTTGVAVTYDDGPAFSNSLQATQGRGMAIVVGALANKFPGGTISIGYEAPTKSAVGSITVRAADGAVTFVTKQL